MMYHVKIKKRYSLKPHSHARKIVRKVFRKVLRKQLRETMKPLHCLLVQEIWAKMSPLGEEIRIPILLSIYVLTFRKMMVNGLGRHARGIYLS